MSRGECDDAALHGFQAGACGAQSRRGEHGAQHHAHLGQREGRAQAPPGAAAEGKPRVGIGTPTDEALGAKREGVGVHVGPPVGEHDVRHRDHPLREVDAAQGHGLCQPAAHLRDDRAQAQRLLDDGVETRVVELRRLQALQHLGVVEDEVEGPRQRGRGGLVPGEEQGEQFVAELFVVEGGAVLALCPDEQGEDVAALRDAGIGTPLADGLDDGGADPGTHPDETAPCRQWAEIAPEARDHQQRLAGEAQKIRRRGAHREEAVLLGETEDGAQDDLEGDRLGAAPQ